MGGLRGGDNGLNGGYGRWREGGGASLRKRAEPGQTPPEGGKVG